MLRRSLSIVLLFVMVVTAGCSSDGTMSSSGGGSANRARSGQNDDSGLACRHFRNVMRDVSDGVLTDAEIRQKVKEIEDDAVIATPAVQRTARQLLAASTTGTVEEFVDAALEVSDACDAAGW